MAAVNPEQAQASLAEISARQHQAAAEGRRSPGWLVPVLAVLVLAISVTNQLLDHELLTLAGWLVVVAGLEVAVRRRRRARVHHSWYTPRRVLRTAVGILLMMVTIVAVTVAARLLLLPLLGLPDLGETAGLPSALVIGGTQALLVLVLFPLTERVCGGR